MEYTIAVAPQISEPGNSSSPIWERVIRAAGHRVRTVNVTHSDLIAQLEGCHAFMWRHTHTGTDQLMAQAIVPALAFETDIELFPDIATCWHYDNKIAQKYLFELHGIPHPKTWVWFDRNLAKTFAHKATYPMVMKLSTGASSSNVILVGSFDEAEHYIDLMFTWGTRNLEAGRQNLLFGKPLPLAARWLRSRARVLLKRLPTRPDPPPELYWQFNKDYVLFQEFIPDNSHDYRITIIGDRAFGYRRFNRQGDFRASGSGDLNTDPDGIDTRAVALAFEVAKKLRTQSLAFDFLVRNGELLLVEISYTFVSWMVHGCPGHWDPQLGWHEGSMWPEEAQAADLLARLDAK